MPFCTPCTCIFACREGSWSTPSRRVSACRVRAGLARRAGTFQLTVRAALAVRALVFQLPMGSGGAPRAVAFHLPVRAGVALRTPVFHLPVRTRVTLLTQRFLPSVGVPLVSHRSRATIPARTRFCAHRKRRGRCCSFEVTFVSDEQIQNRRALASSTQFQSKQQYLKSPNLRTIRTRARS